MAKKHSPQSREKQNPAIIIAYIGLAGTIVTALCTLFTPFGQELAKSIFANTPTPTLTASPTPAETVVPTSLFTPIPTTTFPIFPTVTIVQSLTPTETPTPVPTSTPRTLLPGEDWLYGCVSKAWVIYPASAATAIDEGNCYQEPIALTGSYFVSGQQLSMLMSGPVRSAETFGLFTPLPTSGKVELTIDLDELENGEIWVGIFSEPDPNSSGLMLLIPPGNIRNSVFSLREMPSGFQKYITGPYYTDYGIYNLRFFYSAGSLSFGVNFRNYAEQYPLAFSEKWLFIGYRAKTGNNDIEASFSDLIIQSDE